MRKSPKSARRVLKKSLFNGSKAGLEKGRPLSCRNDFLIEIWKLARDSGDDHHEVFLRARMQGGCAWSYCAWEAWPRRDEVLRLCFALELETIEAQRLLEKSGNRTLDPKLLRDAIILFSFEKHLNLAQAQALLRKLNAAPL